MYSTLSIGTYGNLLKSASLPRVNSNLSRQDVFSSRSSSILWIKSVGIELDISPTTVKTHFKEVKSFLDSYGLVLNIKPKKGLELDGKEENIRMAFLKLLNNISKSNYIFLKD